jgi:phytoene dehydrogenase-like protein
MSTICGLCLRHPLGVCNEHLAEYEARRACGEQADAQGKDEPLPGYRMELDAKERADLRTSLVALQAAAELYRNDTNAKLAASAAALEKSQAEVRRMTIVARAGWESARALAIAGLHRATERAADEALEALDAGAL